LVDVGQNVLFPGPSTQYNAICGNCGAPPLLWNAVDGSTQQATFLLDAHGVSAGVSVRHVGGFGNFQANNAVTPVGSDHERLIDDIQSVGFGANASTWTVSGLPSGPYEVVLFSWAPDDPDYRTALTLVNGLRGTLIRGGPVAPPWTFDPLANYARDRVYTLNGEIVFTVEANQGFGSLNGFIIEPIACSAVFGYCGPSKLNSAGCQPAIHSAGAPSASASSGFTISCNQVINNKSGLLLYGSTGAIAVPFQGGTLCVNSPIHRTTGVNSGGNPPPTNDCSGNWAIDMNAFAANMLGGNPIPELRIPGTVVSAQWWGRDPGFPVPNNSQLSHGVQYFVCP
jgi:hypothetical protein